MTADKRVKSVAFNVKNPEEKDLWKHVSRRNFSGYVKRLIAEDIKRKEAIKNPQNDAKKAAASTHIISTVAATFSSN